MQVRPLGAFRNSAQTHYTNTSEIVLRIFALAN